MEAGGVDMEKDAVEAVSRWLYERAKPHFGGKYRDFPVLRRRVRDLIQEFKDPDMVAVVCAEIIETRRGAFSALASLSFYHFVFVRDGLSYPPGAWHYARWLFDEQNLKVYASIDHWLADWRDAVANGDMDKQLRAARMLKRLANESGAVL